MTDEELDALAHDRHQQTYLELAAEERERKARERLVGMMQQAVRDPRPDLRSWRPLVLGMAAFWAAIILGITLLYSCNAEAGMVVYLEGEDDLGNGFKLCHYTEGYTITIQSHKLCPLSINTGN